jgi:hypothetical protein
VNFKESMEILPSFDSVKALDGLLGGLDDLTKKINQLPAELSGFSE